MSKDQEEKIVLPDADEVAKYAPSGPDATPPPPGDLEARDTPDTLPAQLSECRDKLLRAQAECVNMAKRLNQEHSESLRLAGMGLARDLLAVVDGFERMLGSTSAAAENDPVVQGVRLLAELLQKILRDHGVRAIEAIGQPFDPTQHEAMMQDRESEQPAGTVTAELQRGYTMHDRVLRPARVAVAAPDEETGADRPPARPKAENPD